MKPSKKSHSRGGKKRKNSLPPYRNPLMASLRGVSLVRGGRYSILVLPFVRGRRVLLEGVRSGLREGGRLRMLLN